MIPHYDTGGEVTDNEQFQTIMKLAPLVAAFLQAGGKVPGRASVAGDSPRNDTKLALVSPGEGVIKRSIMNSPNAPELAAEEVRKMKSQKPDVVDQTDEEKKASADFVKAMKKTPTKNKGNADYGDALRKLRDISNQMTDIERLLGKK